MLAPSKKAVLETKDRLADLFQSTKQNIKNIFEEGELAPESVVKNFFTTAADGKNYSTNFYNLDAIISVGYRVKSRVATRAASRPDDFEPSHSEAPGAERRRSLQGNSGGDRHGQLPGGEKSGDEDRARR